MRSVTVFEGSKFEVRSSKFDVFKLETWNLELEEPQQP